MSFTLYERTERLKGIVKLVVVFSTQQSNNVTRNNAAS